jgi:signal transduction histidine kinase
VKAHPTATVFRGDQKSGLEVHLPGSASHLVLPFRLSDRPFYLIIASSSESHYAFPVPDINIIRSTGSVLRARAVQQSVVAADAAKTSFLSSISHELRTPMHGVKASLELVRKSADAGQWSEVEEPLRLAESSGRALLNILNDVLDFGRNNLSKTEVTEIDLAQSAKEIAAVCFAHYGEHLSEKSSVRLEYEDRDWTVVISEAKYQR